MKDFDAKVYGIIVLYNPVPEQLEHLSQNISGQFEKIILVDNSDIINDDVQCQIKKLEKSCHYISLGTNLGIATAQNRGIEYARVSGATHVMLLDQDSMLPPNLVSILLSNERKLLAQKEKVAAVGPAFRDVKTGITSGAISMTPFCKRVLPLKNNVPTESDYLIASGTLIRVGIIDLMGGMNEELFIDFVDIEWCERCGKKGFKSFVISDTVISHNIGSGVARAMGKTVILHSNIRHYYIIRNMVYLLTRGGLSWQHRVFLFFRAPIFIIVHISLSNSKKEKFKLFTTAVLDGLKGNMGKK